MFVLRYRVRQPPRGSRLLLSALSIRFPRQPGNLQGSVMPRTLLFSMARVSAVSREDLESSTFRPRDPSTWPTLKSLPGIPQNPQDHGIRKLTEQGERAPSMAGRLRFLPARALAAKASMRLARGALGQEGSVTPGRAGTKRSPTCGVKSKIISPRSELSTACSQEKARRATQG